MSDQEVEKKEGKEGSKDRERERERGGSENRDRDRERKPKDRHRDREKHRSRRSRSRDRDRHRHRDRDRHKRKKHYRYSTSSSDSYYRRKRRRHDRDRDRTPPIGSALGKTSIATPSIDVAQLQEAQERLAQQQQLIALQTQATLQQALATNNPNVKVNLPFGISTPGPGTQNPVVSGGYNPMVQPVNISAPATLGMNPPNIAQAIPIPASGASIHSLTPMAQEAFNQLFLNGKLSTTDMDSTIYASLAQFEPATQVEIVNVFGAKDVSSILNKGGYMAGIMKRYRQVEADKQQMLAQRQMAATFVMPY